MTRRDAIAERLAQGQPVAAVALAAEFGVSEDAIRRDLRALAADGLCRRVYGGALPLTPGHLPMSARMKQGQAQKTALAAAAAATVQRGELLFLDCGSTNLALAHALPEDMSLTVATNAVDIAAAVLHRADIQLIMLGGLVDPVVGGCVDAAAVQQLATLRIDRGFVGVCALSPEGELSTPNFADAVFKRALVAASRISMGLITTDKIGTGAPFRVAAVGELDQAFLEHDAPAHAVDALTAGGVQVSRAPALA